MLSVVPDPAAGYDGAAGGSVRQLVAFRIALLSTLVRDPFEALTYCHVASLMSVMKFLGRRGCSYELRTGAGVGVLDRRRRMWSGLALQHADQVQ